MTTEKLFLLADHLQQAEKFLLAAQRTQEGVVSSDMSGSIYNARVQTGKALTALDGLLGAAVRRERARD